MSNALAIASVTRLLKDMLNDALINGDVSSNIGDVKVTASPPDRVRSGDATDPTQLNVFLYRVTPNTALSNADLPTRDSRGALVRRPQLALDLHYLLTAYSATDLGAEILLGYAMELFHENPILARGAVREFLAAGVNGGILPGAFADSRASELADQLELIKITPATLSLDDMSKVWTALQTNYRPTVAYLVSVVLIARDQPKRSALPVLSRGPVDPVTGRDRGVATLPSTAPRVPTLTAVVPAFGQPAARLAEVLHLHGFNLDAGDARVVFTHNTSGLSFEMTPLAPARPDRLTVQLPDPPALPPASPLAQSGHDSATWRVGTYRVRVVYRKTATAAERETTSLPVSLAPRTTLVANPAGSDVEIVVSCEPRIRQGQSVTVILGQAEQPHPALGADTSSVSTTFSGFTSGERLSVRLRVDGIESFVIDYSQSPPVLDVDQVVTVP
jgi:hypothetical protein